MTDARSLWRNFLVYSLCLPVAIFLGYMLGQPLDLSSYISILLIFGIMVTPVLLKFYHPFLVASWNMSMVLFFIPGKPQLWLVLAFAGFGVLIFQRAMNPRGGVIHVPSVAWPLGFLTVVVVATAYVNGGLGLRVFGSEAVGGKRYILMLGAILGYFTLVSRPIPPERAKLYVGLYLLGGITNLMSDAILYLPSQLYWVFWMFPVDPTAMSEAAGMRADDISRYFGTSMACIFLGCYLLARNGIAQMFTRKRLSLLLFIAAMVGTLFGGYRSFFLLLAGTFVFVFLLEGLLRTRFFLPFALSLVAAGSMVLAFPTKLPMSIQRSLSFLPIPVDPVAKYNAMASNEWRIQIWRSLLPEIPKYLIVGKGLGIDASALGFAHDIRRGDTGTAETATLAGDYHNGPLSVIIPFGIFGVLGFIWFITAALRALYLNFRYGDPELHTVNVLLLAFFISRLLLFLVVFGGFYGDIMHFCGILGLSLSLNRGIKKPATAALEVTRRDPLRNRLPIPSVGLR